MQHAKHRGGVDDDLAGLDAVDGLDTLACVRESGASIRPLLVLTNDPWKMRRELFDALVKLCLLGDVLALQVRVALGRDRHDGELKQLFSDGEHLAAATLCLAGQTWRRAGDH